MNLISHFLRHFNVLKMKKLGLYNYVQDHTHGKLMAWVILELDSLWSCHSGFKSIEPSEPKEFPDY